MSDCSTRGSPCVLSRLFERQVSRRPHETALKTPSEKVTFSQLHTRAMAIRDALAAGGANGSEISARSGRDTTLTTVAIACGHSQIAEICAVFGVVLSGGCFVSLDDALPAPRVTEVILDAQPDVLILSAGLLPAGRPEALEESVGLGGKAVTAAVLKARSLHDFAVLELDQSGWPLQKQDASSTRYRSEALGNSSEVLPGKTIPDASESFPAAGAKEEDISLIARSTTLSPVDTVLGDQQVAVGRQPQHPMQTGFPSPRGDPVSDGRMVDGGDIWAEDSSSDERDPLYVLYTSGSTGVPKGVRGTRAGAVNRIRFGWSAFPFREDGELVARRTPSCFVDFVAEVFSPLLAGVPLFLPPLGAAADPLRLVPALAEARVTRVTLTPSLLASLLRTAPSLPGPLLPYLRTWLVSGEALHPDLALRFRERVAPEAQLINLYGSTEVSGDATYCTLDEILEAARVRREPNASAVIEAPAEVLIGKPLHGVHLSIVGPNLRPVNFGQPGELLVGGVGVALGYHRRPQETADTFLLSVKGGAALEGGARVHIPGLEPGRRVFRTGDRVVQPVASGPLFWLGRLDGEVKIRGVRVSLEGVEVLACRAAGLPFGSFAAAYDPGSVNATTIGGSDANSEESVASGAARAPDRGRLVGFFVEEGGRESYGGLAELKRKLAREMTAAQLPSILVPIVGGFPLTTTGKVDRRALLRKYRFQTAGNIGDQALIMRDTGAPLSSPPEFKGVTQPEMRQTARAAREAVAKGVFAVLPEAQAAVAAWLANRGQPPSASCDLTNTTFEGLGGTSLLAVEAAWLASRHVERRNGPGTAVSAAASVLGADDLLRGTLEEAASTLKDILDAEMWVAESAPASVTVGAASKLVPPGVRQDESQSSLSRLVGMTKSGSAPSFGLKRHQEFQQEKTRLVEPSSLWTIGRAGAGLHHTPECLGAALDGSTEINSGGLAKVVELRVQWHSCLSKCIDASPLVVVAKPTTSLPVDGRQKKRRSRTGSDAAVEVGIQTAPPGCLCQSLPLCQLPPSNTLSRDGTPVSGALGEGVLSDCVPPEFVGEFGEEEGTVYIGSHSGEFKALNLATGHLEWSFTAGGRIESGAACSPDGSTVFVGCHDRCLYAINRDAGTVLWTFETRDAIKCTPVCVTGMRCGYSSGDKEGVLDKRLLSSVSGGEVLIGSHDGVMRCLSQTGGELLWSFDCRGALFASPAHDEKASIVYAATTKGRVIAIYLCATTGPTRTGDRDSTSCENSCHDTDLERNRGDATAETGAEIRRQPAVLWDRQLPAPCFSTPAVCSATAELMLGCVDAGLYCLSSVTGDQLWVCWQGRSPVFSSPCLLPCWSGTAEAGGRDQGQGPHVLWGCHDGNVRCRNGTYLAWTTDIGQGRPVFSSPFFAAIKCERCVLPCALVFACSVSGMVSAMRLSDGVVVGEYKLPKETFSSPVVAGRRVVVGCRDNDVYVFDVVVRCSRCTEGT